MDSTSIELTEENEHHEEVSYSERVHHILNARNYRDFWEANNKYRDGSSLLMLLINIQMAIIVIMSIVLYFYVSSEPVQDGFYVVNNGDKVSRIQGLESPNTSVDSLSSWAASAVVDVMTFGFNDIDERFEISKKNFTQPGWEAFKAALIASGMIKNVIDNKQMVTAAPVSEPVLLKDGFMKGSYQWVFQMEIMITYRSGGEQKNDVRRVNLFIAKVPTDENPRGVAISEWLLM